jgi:hypothetical protein
MSTDSPQPPLPPPPPDPFGDPSRVNRENQASIKKGISIGCIIISVGVLGFITMIAAIVALVFGIFRNTDAASFALEKAQTSLELKAEIGEPISMGTFVGGNVNISNGYGNASVTVPVTGPKGEASVHVVGTKEPGQAWQFTEATAIVGSSGKRIDLLETSPQK